VNERKEPTSGLGDGGKKRRGAGDSFSLEASNFSGRREARPVLAVEKEKSFSVPDLRGGGRIFD